ncbi:MAG: hypothetical protein JW991_04830 [Candidatus Pacebacteria bacterium]|nr:hypothetical protein [Candidatus Paceibacterota bacterium]
MTESPDQLIGEVAARDRGIYLVIFSEPAIVFGERLALAPEFVFPSDEVGKKIETALSADPKIGCRGRSCLRSEVNLKLAGEKWQIKVFESPERLGQLRRESKRRNSNPLLAAVLAPFSEEKGKKTVYVNGELVVERYLGDGGVVTAHFTRDGQLGLFYSKDRLITPPEASAEIRKMQEETRGASLSERKKLAAEIRLRRITDHRSLSSQESFQFWQAFLRAETVVASGSGDD